jgi:hypothetical protein
VIQKAKDKVLEYGIVKSILTFLVLSASLIVLLAVGVFFTLMLMERYDNRYTEPVGAGKMKTELHEENDSELLQSRL